jgi:hypothetical protein
MLAVSQESECVLHARANSQRRNCRGSGEGHGCGLNGAEESEGVTDVPKILAEREQGRVEKAQASEQRLEQKRVAQEKEPTREEGTNECRTTEVPA